MEDLPEGRKRVYQPGTEEPTPVNFMTWNRTREGYQLVIGQDQADPNAIGEGSRPIVTEVVGNFLLTKEAFWEFSAGTQTFDWAWRDKPDPGAEL
jgi:hypothetical protein